MHSSTIALPDDPTQLQAEVVQLRDVVKENEQTIAEKEQLIVNKEQALTEKTRRIEQLLDYILLLRKRQFGASADRTNKNQVSLFDEAELEQLLAELDLPADWDEGKPAPQKKAKDEKKKPVHFFRQEKATPILDKIKTWLDEKATKVLPKSPLGSAITYTLNLWPRLTTEVDPISQTVIRKV